MSKILLLGAGTREESRNNKLASYVKEYFDELNVSSFIYKELYITSFQYLVFLILAVSGYFEWKNQLKNDKN